MVDAMDQPWVPAAAAAKLLGIQLRTLYAYASRGRVRSVAGVRGKARLYALADLERLKARRDARSGHGAVAAGALRWGEPVLESALTELTPEGPSYRGHLAIALAARGVPFENVAELLWSGYLAADPVIWSHGTMPLAALARFVPVGAKPLEVMSLLVQVAALDDPQRGDPRPDAIVTRGRRLVPLLAAVLAPGLTAATVTRALTAGSVAAIVARALGLDDDVVPAIDAALVVLADHELNASSFAARVAASTEADPYAVIAAALATLSGRKHGGASEDVTRFVDEVGSPEAAPAAVAALRAKGRVPPGFGHPIYVAGDPRTAPLLAYARANLERTPRVYQKRARTLFAIADLVPAPSVDVGLAAMMTVLGAAPSAGPGLFAVARSAGWLAHALEQRTAGFMLRPRARYVGIRTTT